MKKVVNMLMLMLVLIFSVQANVSFHYCHGKLISADITRISETGCCGVMDGNQDSSSEEPTFSSECCQIHNLQLSTDNFSHQYNEVKIILPYQFVASLVDNDVFDIVNPDYFNRSPFYKPYWQIQADRGVDDNALFCVFRI